MSFNFVKLSKPDLVLIEKWLSKPHVAMWFEDKELWLDEISTNLDSDWVWHFRADLYSKPVGFAQCYDTSKSPQGPWSSQPPATLGIDYFLGETSLLGKGNGKKLVNDFIEFIKMHFRTKRLIVDPDEENIRSNLIIKKCGFQFDRESGLFINELIKSPNKSN